nr:MarR family transcriptional regulator [Actibacterium sp. 188UL27-1]
MLTIAAETSSAVFQAYYKDRYGMLRTEWRVFFHLGRYGPMTAKEICDRARIHKTKVSRAVAALAAKRYLTRKELPEDRRQEILRLTKSGELVFKELYRDAADFNVQMMADFTVQEQMILRKCLIKIADLDAPEPAPTDTG